MSDKMREEFEAAFYEAQCQEICVAEDRSVAWAFFAASRESLVVELPPKIGPCNTAANGYVRPEAEHYDEAIDDCRQAIESLGLRVKP